MPDRADTPTTFVRREAPVIGAGDERRKEVWLHGYDVAIVGIRT